MQKAIQQHAKKTVNHFRGYRTEVLGKISGGKIRTEIASESARQTLTQNWRKLPAQVAHCAPMGPKLWPAADSRQNWRRDRKNEHRDAEKPILRKTASRTDGMAHILGENGFFLTHLRFKPRRRQLTAFPGMVLEITSSYGGIWVYSPNSVWSLPGHRSRGQQILGGRGPTGLINNAISQIGSKI